ncbi:MAG: rod shape-determining protein MreC [Candidatus Aminicenantes bacterium]|nr:MAG: rod shape-determining protein MreC [Candidatus Aminicenantes bacterium]
MPLFLKEKKSLIVLITLIFIQLVLVSLQAPLGQRQNYFEKAIFAIFSPLQHVTVSFTRKIANLWKNYFHLQNVQGQNQKLREEIFILQQENNILLNTLRRFRGEKEIQDNLLVIRENILVAHVIGLDASNFYKSLVIDKGSLDGLKKNMVVLDGKGHLVGRTIEPISLKEATVQLITDTESGISVFTQKRVMGVLKGDARGRCSLDYILATTRDISMGEEVVTSGFDGIYPSGIKVGKIISITESDPLFKGVKVQPYFDFRQLYQVAVVKIDPKDLFDLNY